VDTEYYDDIIIGGGKAGKTLAPALVANGRKTALVERSLNTIGGGCINLACIPTKTMVASAEIAHPVRNIAAYGVKTNLPVVDLATVIQRKRLPGSRIYHRYLKLNGCGDSNRPIWIYSSQRSLRDERTGDLGIRRHQWRPPIHPCVARRLSDCQSESNRRWQPQYARSTSSILSLHRSRTGSGRSD
jgi:choline dehydrogenase-like flavoprotein